MSQYDYIVVGSGPSGGILSRKLHSAGAKVVLLEAGKFFKKDTFPKTEAEASAQLYWGGGIEFDVSARMAFLRAKCMGGTSIVNQCLLDRFDDIALSDWKTASGVDFFTPEALAPYYDAVEERIALHTFNRSEFTRNAELFTKGCDDAGYKWGYLRRGQSDCALEDGNDCLGCLGGCHRDSKQSSLVVAIQKAEKEGLEIRSEFMVDSIKHELDGVTVFGTQSGKATQIKGAKVILAAGSFGTTGIMLRSGFKKALPALGANFSSHPQIMTFGIFDEPVNAHKGAFQTVASKDPNFRQKGFKLENVFAPPISISMLFDVYGKRHQEIMKNYRYMSCLEVAIRDEAAGSMTIDKKGNLQVTKNLTDQDLKRKDLGLDAVHNILAKSGAREVVKSPYYFGLHLMGGCSIGVDGQKSVVNPEFQVHGFKNVYIADSSIFPNAPGINPSLSIMMLSEKLGQELVKA